MARLALRLAMYRAVRTLARPPAMWRGPLRGPLSSAKGRQARECGGLPAVQRAQLGQVAQQRGGRAGSHPFDRAEPRGFGGEHGVAGEQGSELGAHFLQVPGESRHAGGEVLGDGLGQAGHLARLFGGEHRLELLAPGDPGRQLGLGGARRARGRGRVGRAEGGEQGRVDGVGLGALAAAPGKVAHLARVDDAHRDAGGVQGGDNRSLPAAGGLADDVDGLSEGLQARHQSGAARRVVGAAGVLALKVEIEGGFGDVEASVVDEGRVHEVGNRLSLVDASSWLGQRCEFFASPGPDRFALPDGFKDPRGGCELCLARGGVVATHPAARVAVLG